MERLSGFFFLLFILFHMLDHVRALPILSISSSHQSPGHRQRQEILTRRRMRYGQDTRSLSFLGSLWHGSSYYKRNQTLPVTDQEMEERVEEKTKNETENVTVRTNLWRENCCLGSNALIIFLFILLSSPNPFLYLTFLSVKRCRFLSFLGTAFNIMEWERGKG